MACTLDGLYFRYTKRWPLVQVMLPFLLCASITHLGDYLSDLTGTSITKEDFMESILLLTCALDFVTNRNLNKVISTS
ncbi:unnamed protein product, partial [Mesorhabditis belari]|uniref:Uncharacterized protein n=1 Tax=Mesorhabditis belari TaxID=2138241 RepID=A0AAF3ET69_9BILA